MAAEMRKVFGDCMLEEMKKNENIVLIDADLAKADGTFGLREAFPGRAFDAGIAEANMAGIAAGMAAYGLIPVINTFSPFATRRICDQIAISICYANQNVKIIGTDPGITAEYNGGTHMSFEDIGVLRSIPNIVIAEPADGFEIKKMLPAVLAYRGPVYVRMYRKGTEEIHTHDYDFELGKAHVMKEGRDVTVIASGIMVAEALKAEQLLAERGIDAEIINMHTVKPIDRDAILKSVSKTGAVVTCENHSVLGGLRAAVAEVLTEELPMKVYCVGVRDEKGEVGKLSDLKQRFGLTAEKIAELAARAAEEK